MSHISLTPAWSVQQMDGAECALQVEFPTLRPDVIATAVRLARREVSPQEGLEALMTNVRQVLEKRRVTAAVPVRAREAPGRME